MKPIKFKKKLRFHKETIADLNNHQLRAVHGGKDKNQLTILIQDCLIMDTHRDTCPDTCRCPDTYTACWTGCPSNDSNPLICCHVC